MGILALNMNKAALYLSRQSRPKVLMICFVTVVVMGVLDFLTGYDFSFSIFYLIPIGIAAWHLELGDAIAISTASYVAMATSDYLAGIKYLLHPLIHVWNELIRFGFFVIFAYLISELRYRLAIERTLSRVDHLTQIANRRAFYELLDAEILRSRRQNQSITVAYIDIDRFKQINDEFGHRVGDRVLQSAANTIKSALRATDAVARLGGDEFAVLLPQTNAHVSRIVIHKVHSNLLGLAQENGWPIGFSIGCVTFVKPPDTTEEIIHYADRIMYACKKSGNSSIDHEVVQDSTRILTPI